MKTIQELEKMLPPEVAGIAGCTAYNADRAAIWQAVEVKHRMAAAKLDRAGTSADAAAAIERGFADVETDYAAACAKVARKRRALLCEPETKPAPVELDVSALKVAAKTPGATAFNAKLDGFKKRQFTALEPFLKRQNAAFLAWTRDESNANLRAWNKARGELHQAARPFAAERRKIEAERARMLAPAPKGGAR